MLLAHQIKLEEDTRAQTLKNHSENVSRLMVSFLDNIDIQNLAIVIGELHDCGKAKKEFQDYLKDPSKYIKGSINHSSAGTIYIYNKLLNDNNAFIKLTSQFIYMAIMSHHSGLPDCLSPHGEDGLIKRLQKKEENDVAESISNFLAECVDEHCIETNISEAVNEIQRFINKNNTLYARKIDEKIFAAGMLEKYIFSCLLDADRYDTACFYNGSIPQFESENKQCWEKLLKRLEDYMSTFKIDSEINQLRSEISNSCKSFAQNPQGIYQLYVPTGGGKTLSSLRFALTHAVTHENIKRIIYVMPYLTILTQNSKTIKEILEVEGENFILEHFSNLVEDENVKDEEDVSRKDALIERWDSEIIITSMVHFLESLFSGKKQSTRRMHQLSNAIIIIDEIQTLPDRVVYMFNQAMNFLKNFCNSTVILCSATQPTLHNVKYPIQLNEPIHMVKDYQLKFFQFKRVDITDMTKSSPYRVDEIADLVYEKIAGMDNMLIILNTKKGVVNTYRELLRRNDTLPESEKYTIICLSTNMCGQHRHEKLDWIIKNLKTKRIICVSTSLVEAGIDISFKTVVRALCGLDSIAQAAGRCNRHGELEKGYMYLINTDEIGVTRLPKVVKGIRIMGEILDEYKIDQKKFDNDLLSPKSLELYYRRYYYDSEMVLGYPSKELNGSDMFTCFSRNLDACKIYTEKNKMDTPYILNQSFKSAGEVFEVIEKNTMNVIVPYGEGKEIITELLRKSLDFNYAKKLLKKAQRFSLNMYTNQSNKTSQGICFIEEYNVFFLAEGYYHEEIGLDDFESTAGYI